MDYTTWHDQRPSHPAKTEAVVRLEKLAKELWQADDDLTEQYLAGEISRDEWIEAGERARALAEEAERELLHARRQALCLHQFVPAGSGMHFDPATGPYDNERWECVFCGFDPDNPLRDFPLLTSQEVPPCPR